MVNIKDNLTFSRSHEVGQELALSVHRAKELRFLLLTPVYPLAPSFAMGN